LLNLNNIAIGQAIACIYKTSNASTLTEAITQCIQVSLAFSTTTQTYGAGVPNA
jgi:hypothetical protein